MARRRRFTLSWTCAPFACALVPMLLAQGVALAYTAVDPLSRDSSPAPPALIEPANGSTTVMPSPHLAWSDACDPTARSAADAAARSTAGSCGYSVQVATCGAFTEGPHGCVVASDALPAIIARWVPRAPLPTDTLLHWRVAAVAQGAPAWSPAATFTVVPPRRTVTVPAGADWDAVQAATAAAAAQTPSTLTFTPGEHYALRPPAAVGGVYPALFNLSHVSDVVIDGAGASVTLTGLATHAQFYNCSRVVLQNITLDIDPPPYAALRVTAVDAGALQFRATLLPGHPAMDAFPALAQYGIAEVMDATTMGVKRGARLVVAFTWAADERGGAGRYVFNVTGSKDVGVEEGDVFVVDPRTAVGFRAYYCDEVQYRDVVVHAMANEGFNSIYSSRLSFLGVSVKLLPGRYLAANNGGHNHHSSRVAPYIDSCWFENTGDDVSNFNGLVLSAAEQPSPTQLLLRPNPFDFAASMSGGAVDVRAGDTLAFWNDTAGVLVGKRDVVAVQAVDARGRTAVTLDAPIDGIVTGPTGEPGAVATQVMDLTRTQSQLVWRRTVARNGRRVGILAHGARVWVDSNTFEGLGGGFVEAWNDPAEGLGLTSALITNNTVRNVTQLSRNAAPLWTAGFGHPGSGSMIHSDIVVANNTIASGPGAVFWVQDAANVTFEGNRVTRCATDSAQTLVQQNTATVADDDAAPSLLSDEWICVKTPQ